MEFMKGYWKDVTLAVLALIVVGMVGKFAYDHRNDHDLLHRLIAIQVQREQLAQQQQQQAQQQRQTAGTPGVPPAAVQPIPAPTK